MSRLPRYPPDIKATGKDLNLILSILDTGGVVNINSATNSGVVGDSLSPTTPNVSGSVSPDPGGVGSPAVVRGFSGTFGIDNFAQSHTAFVLLTWTPNPISDFVSRYDIYYHKGSDPTLYNLTVGGDVNSVRVNNLFPGNTYSFAIQAHDAANRTSLWTPELTVNISPDSDPPSVPTGLTATSTATGIYLTWNEVGPDGISNDLKQYRLAVSLDAGATYPTTETIGPGNSYFFVPKAATPTTIWLKVGTMDWTGNVSAYSAPVSASTGTLFGPITINPGPLTIISPFGSGALYLTSNYAATYPPSGTTSGAIGSNFSNGVREVNFWNTDTSDTGVSFDWRQKTGASASTLLATLDYTGILSVKGTTISLGAGSPAANLFADTTNFAQQLPSGAGSFQWKAAGGSVISSLTNAGIFQITTILGKTTITLGGTDINVNRAMQIGVTNPSGTGALPGYGAPIMLSGGPAVAPWDSDNSDPLGFVRYNVSSNVSELRAQIGDDPGTADAFVMGTANGDFNSGWVAKHTFDAAGNVTHAGALQIAGYLIGATTGSFSGRVSTGGLDSSGSVLVNNFGYFGGTSPPHTPSSGDLILSRGGGSTGVLYLGNSAAHYLYYDGTDFNFNGGALKLGSNALSGVTTLAMGGALTGATTGSFSGLLSSAGLTATSGDITASTGNITATVGSVSAAAGQVISSGTTAGLVFQDRAPGINWQWYSSSSIARLYNGSSDTITITTAGAVGGITTLTATTLAGTLSTAAQGNITSVGTLTSLTLSGAFSGATTGSFTGRLTTTGFQKPGGTSFPASPGTNDRFMRTDAEIEFYYDGTRWLSTELFICVLSTNFATTINTSTAAAIPALPTGCTDIWLVDHVIQSIVSTTNNGTNFWANTLTKYNVTNTGTNIDTAISTVSDTVANWTKHVTSMNALLFNGTTYYDWNEQWAKTSAPGQVNANAYMTYRFVAT